jgi:ribosome-binding ATPase
MSVSVGIVGLPNVGKSTLFNAITEASVEAANYPFCTIEPNIGIVPVPNEKAEHLSDISGSTKIIHSTIKFVDIAGLVKGASKGEGLGNKFLSNIRDVSAIAHVLRCFEDDNIVHVDGKIDPIADLETIHVELVLSDLEQTEKLCATYSKKAKGKNKEEQEKMVILERIKDALSKNEPVRSIEFTEKELPHMKEFQFLTAKKTLYVANVSEKMLTDPSPKLIELRAYMKNQDAEYLELCANLEFEIATLDNEEKIEFLKEYNIEESGLDRLAQASFHLLDLQTYLTTGEKETRSWTIPVGASAPQAAGVIHTDFEKGFIRANIISYKNFVECGGWKPARDKGLVRQEGKDYVMKEDDIVEFLFNN